MASPILILPLVVAVILIVYGRVNHRSRWGNWIAVAGRGARDHNRPRRPCREGLMGTPAEER